jgi:hypothetical protein
MRWFRKHIGHGSWLALVALAINFTLAFGHVHGLDGHDSERPLILAMVAGDSGQSQKHHPADHHADYLCPICMAVAIMGNGLASTPPALPIELAETRIDRPIYQLVSAPQPPCAGFQSRGPPLS